VLGNRSNAGAAGFLVEAAFALESEETRLLGREISGERTAGVRIADRDVTFFPEGMIRQAVFLEIAVHIAICPVDDRMDFQATVLAADNIKLLARTGLGATKTGEPRARAEFGEGALHR